MEQALQLILQAAAVVQACDRIAVGFLLQSFRAGRFVFDEAPDLSRQTVHCGDHPSQFARFGRERDGLEVALADGDRRSFDFGQGPQYVAEEHTQRKQRKQIDRYQQCDGLHARMPQLQIREVRMTGHQHAPQLAPAGTDQRFGAGRAQRKQPRKPVRHIALRRRELLVHQGLAADRDHPYGFEVAPVERGIDRGLDQRAIVQRLQGREPKRERSRGVLRVRFELLLQVDPRVGEVDGFDPRHDRQEQQGSAEEELPE